MFKDLLDLNNKFEKAKYKDSEIKLSVFMEMVKFVLSGMQCIKGIGHLIRTHQYSVRGSV